MPGDRAARPTGAGAHRPRDPLDLTGRRVLISGGVGDLGLAIVTALATHGATVVASDVVDDAEGVGRLGSCPPDRVHYVRSDVTDPAAVEQLLDRVVAVAGAVDVVCCHAGVVADHPVEQFPVAEFDTVMDVNVRGAFLLASATARRWRAAGRPGQLVFTTSWVQDVPWPGISPYSASKAAVVALMRGFARELAPHGIRSNAVAPGIVGSGMAKRQWDTDPAYRARARRAVPLGALQTPESVANAFLFLASDLSSYMTGSTLLVDGGCSLYPMD